MKDMKIQWIFVMKFANNYNADYRLQCRLKINAVLLNCYCF